MPMSQIILSASRRTDIPAFYMPWFMSGIEAGRFEVINPYNQKISWVPGDVNQVHTIVFWSKNFGPFLENDYGKILAQRGYNLYFNFTINSENSVLEPFVPPLKNRLDQLTSLVNTFGAEAIQWRFDPICFFRSKSGNVQHNLDQFETIARHAARLGLHHCITSFVDLYRKVLRRVKKKDALELIAPPLRDKKSTLKKMAALLNNYQMQLQLCCEKELLTELTSYPFLGPSACIPSEHLIALYGPGISLAKDNHQRRSSGCTCGISKDIGSYHRHPCHHDCLFCYANPISDIRK
jgi:hypothetical protein